MRDELALVADDDLDARVIVAVEAETATGSEADALETQVGRARFAGHAAREIGADAGYASLAGDTRLELAAATAVNLKRVPKAEEGRSDEQTGHGDINHANITELDPLATTQRSTGS